MTFHGRRRLSARFPLLMICLLLLGRPPFAEDKPVPSGGVSLVAAGGIEAFRAGGAAASDAVVTKVAVSGQPFSQAFRIRTKAKPNNDWDMQAVARTVAAAKKGEVALAVVFGRALETSDEMGEATVTFVFEKAGPDYDKSVTREMKFGKDWRTYYIPFVIRESYPAGGASCNLKYGYKPQTVELGGVAVINFGSAVKIGDLPRTVTAVRYQGREPDAAWRRAAAERIEKHRKGDLTVVVRDALGKPVPGARITVAMKRHAYHFGAAVTARLLTADTEDGRKYRTVVEENFNKVVFENDLKIGPWERGKTTAPTANYHLANTLKALAWCRERGILVRGHTLLWGPLDKKFYPRDLGFDIDGGDWQKMKQRLLGHLEEKAVATGAFVSEWDVINHPVATWGDRGRCWDTVLGREFYGTALNRARALNPGQLLYVNEGSDFPGDNEAVRAAYEKLIADLIAARSPLDGIGFMSHFGETSLAGMDSVQALLERYAAFGLKLQSTELDVGTGGDEAAQADYYRDFMTMFFSHPATVGIVMWGFWEKSHWEPDRALYRADWKLKPCGQAWLDLVKKQWWTNATGTTDKAGTYQVRGFLGEYEITVNALGKTAARRVDFTKNGAGETIVIK